MFELARREGQVKIERPNGEVFVLRPENASASPLDVPGIDLGISTDEIVETIREGRERG
ncbi:MAG TPA: hypothetical protein PKC65_15640 [Pyrinomonadaceae bacterium]|nr:hypothetical protein [Pyrinomonadaceae bacterium]